jgi:hypothetical protein
MNNEQLHELVKWLNMQIEHANKSIVDANKAHNFGREAQLEGMRDAFVRCLNMLNVSKG